MPPPTETNPTTDQPNPLTLQQQRCARLIFLRTVLVSRLVKLTKSGDALFHHFEPLYSGVFMRVV